MSTKDWIEKDFYKVLGVSKDAKPDEIKKAFRKLARENHPDQNQNDPKAEQRFKDISEANSVLSDPAKRKEYDEARSLFGGGHIDGVGQPNRCLAPPLQNRGQVRRGHAVWHGNERRKIVERVVGLAGAVHPAIQAFAAGLAATLRHGVAQVGSGLAPGRQPFAYGLHGVAHGAQRAGHSLQPPGERGERRS